MTVTADRRRILIVEDDPGCRALLQAIFVSHGFRVTSTDSVLGAPELIERLRPDVIVLDLALPYRSGASWLVELKADPENRGDSGRGPLCPPHRAARRATTNGTRGPREAVPDRDRDRGDSVRVRGRRR